MKHLSKRSKFGRFSKQRNALFRALVTDFLVNGKLKTTLVKTKNVQPIVEKLITVAKNGLSGDTIDMQNSKKKIMQYLYKNEALVNIFTIAEKSKNRNGGYTRIIKGYHRLGDAADVALLEFVD